MRVTPTGKICTRCTQRTSIGYNELHTMCCECFERYVVNYTEAQLVEYRRALRAARLRDSETRAPNDKEF